MVKEMARDILRPRLAALVAEAEREGISPSVAVAVLLDLMETEHFGVPAARPGGDA